MLTFNEVITHEHENEHDLEHVLEHKKQFSTPKIFDANGNINKRWYVYYSYRDPKSGKLKRMRNIYGKANSFKTKADRYTLLNLYKRRLLKLLKDGYNPLIDNTEYHKGKLKKASKKVEPKTEISKPSLQPIKKEASRNDLTIDGAFNKAIELKTNVIGEKSLDDYKSRLKGLNKWLKKNHKTVVYINDLNKKLVLDYLNQVQLNSSARNRNNYRTVFSTIFQVLEDNELIDKNFITQISILKTTPKRHKTYTIKEQNEIFEYLEVNDPKLLMFIKFMAYSFLRPIEVCRIQIKNVNIEEKTIQFQEKNKALKTKIIPKILLEELPDLTKFNKEDFLFTPNGFGGNWDASVINRRDYFSKRFKKTKDILNLNNNYGLYSFRHTIITKVYRALAEGASPFEAKSKLLQITGHSTMKALERYLRDIDAELPDDYSNLLK